MSDDDVAIIGVGMHPWGKWGRNFVEYGLVAAADALRDADLKLADIQFIVSGETVRNGYPGYVAGSTFARALGWTGVPIASCYAACASGAQAIDIARSRILAGLCDVALVMGADTTPKGFLAPNVGDRPDDPDWLRFRLLGATNPTYFAFHARRRIERFGATGRDFAQVKVKNARHGLANTNARYRKSVTVDEVLGSAMVADPLRLLDICATSDGAAAAIMCSGARAKQLGKSHAPRIVSVAVLTPTYPSTIIDLPDIATDAANVIAPSPAAFANTLVKNAYDQAGMGPGDLDLAEVYDLSTALELDWYEHLGLCEPGGAERLLRDGLTSIGGRIPVNPSGGLACFGEAVPAQAIAQVCELVWQLRGTAGSRQVSGARAGIAVNQGLFGHGSATILAR